MATEEVFENLKSLQDILVQKYDLEKKIKEAPKQLSTQEELLARLKKEYISKNSEYEETKVKVGNLRLELDEAVKSRENGEKGMDAVSTHREYEALEKQIAEATEKENSIRHDLQKEEKILAEINEALKNYETMISSQESELVTEKDALNSQLEGYQATLADLQKEEDKITPNLDQEILFKFQRIIQRNSEGIVAVRGGVCTGCHMLLPAQFANTVRVGDNINFCPYCSRILYYEEVEEDQMDSYFDLNSAGSLVDLDDDDLDGEEEIDEEEGEEKPLYEDEADEENQSEDEEDEEEVSGEDSEE